MRPPELKLHIERLVLDGLPLKPGEERLVQAALEAELTRLLVEGGLAETWQAGGAVPSLPAASAQISPHASPTTIGRQVAQSVYSSLGGSQAGGKG